MRKVVIPAIPKQIFVLQGVPVTSAVVNMVLFSVLMIVAAYSMIQEKEHSQTAMQPDYAMSRLLLCSTVVGLITGLLGAGGGFVLIPTLVVLMGVPIKEAIGTSLLIIALNSLIGFTMDLSHFAIQWKFLGCVTLMATAGIFMGIQLGKKVSAQHLKSGFGWFVLIMGIAIFLKELVVLILKIHSSHSVIVKLK